MGKTKAQAYRESYKANPAPSTILTEPYAVAANPIVSREITAYKLAIEAEKHRTPAQLKALLVQQLVQHSLDDEFPPASRVACLKLLGSLFEVGAFVERKEITTVNRSDDIRSRLLARLQTVTVDTDVDDALDLLAEIRKPADSQPMRAAALDAPTAPGDAHLGHGDGASGSHTIPLKQSPQKSFRQDNQPSPDTEDPPFESM